MFVQTKILRVTNYEELLLDVIYVQKNYLHITKCLNNVNL